MASYEEFNEFTGKMDKTFNNLREHFATVRAGRANASILDQLSVDYYGAATPINQLASVSTPDPRSLLISPWDTNALKEIEKAILSSDIGINPNNDGKVIRLSFPQPTEERRKELAKQVKKYGEEAKVAIRNLRRDGLDKFKKMEKADEITVDDLTDMEKQFQKTVDDYIKKVEDLTDKKEKELFEI